MACYGIIKEKLSSALNAEKTLYFLKNILNDNGLGLSNSAINLNRFLFELEEIDEDIKTIENGNTKRKNNNIKICDKRILIRTTSTKSAGHISFKSYKYEREEDVDLKKVIEEINTKLNFYDYIFLIRIEEELNRKTKQMKACYFYHLFPTEIFKIEPIKPSDYKKYKKKSSYADKNWVFNSFTNFYLKYNADLLIEYNIQPFYFNQ